MRATKASSYPPLISILSISKKKAYVFNILYAQFCSLHVIVAFRLTHPRKGRKRIFSRHNYINFHTKLVKESHYPYRQIHWA